MNRISRISGYLESFDNRLDCEHRQHSAARGVSQF